jgi:hypothetical protein
MPHSSGAGLKQEHDHRNSASTPRDALTQEAVTATDIDDLKRSEAKLHQDTTHIFNHQGQVLAMCRTIGKPNTKSDLDYPVD